MKKIMVYISLISIIILIQLFSTVPVFAHGAVYDTSITDNSKMKITLKWSDPEEKRGLRIAYFNIKNGKTVRIGYEAVDGGTGTASIDIDLSTVIAPVRVNLIPAGVPGYLVFSDIEGTEAEEYITHLHDAGIVNGRGENYFMPSESITRAEFATLIVKALKLEGTAVNDKGFTDIDNHWARDIMLLASGKGLLTGYEDGTLRPDNTITVAEASTIIGRAFTFKTGNKGYYTRIKQNMWYSRAVKQIFDAGILSVTDSIYKNFDEEAIISRADCAMMISRALSTY